MFRAFEPGVSLWWDVVWQATAFLAAGIGVSAILRRWPARAHQVLVLAIVAAIGTPIVSKSVRMAEWGVLKTPGELRFRVATDKAASHGEPGRITPDPTQSRENTGTGDRVSKRAEKNDISAFEKMRRPAAAGMARTGSKFDSIFAGDSLRNVLFLVWAVASGLMVHSITTAMIRGRRMMRNATAIDDPHLHAAAAEAARRLGIASVPEIRASGDVRCPSIWCWSRRPVLLIPAGFESSESKIDWTAIFAHEMAHWRRADQVTSLLGEFLVCIVPFNPLAWWAKARLGQFAELACDDWVLASGIDGADYADSLLKLIPGRGNAMALAAVSSRGGLVARVRHILDDRRSSPRTGTAWTLACGTVAATAVTAIALAQEGAAKPAQGARTEMKDSTDKPAESSKERTATGQVLGPDGKPVPGAKIYWIAHRKHHMPIVALPRDDDRSFISQPVILGQAVADANGRFESKVRYDHEDIYEMDGVFASLAFMAPGLGITHAGFAADHDSQEFTIRIPAEQVITGRLLAPDGKPAAGVRVTLDAINDDVEGQRQGLFVGPTDRDDSIPEFWPKAILTDADGRFTLRGVPRGVYATLSFRNQDYALDEVTVSTRTDGKISNLMKAFEIVPVKPDFSYALKPARPVVGRVTDKATGKPLTGIAVEMIPMRSHGGLSFRGRTDADGRYRISGHWTDRTYHTTVYPPANSGYLDATDVQQGWPAGAKEMVKDFALAKSQVVTGRVIDQATKQPVAGAAVVYQPEPKNTNNVGKHDFRNPTVTDGEGRFSITALPGPGSLSVESPDGRTMRIRAGKLRYGRTAFPHGHVKIDVPKEGALPPVEIALKQGVTLVAKAVGPDGQAVKGLVAFGVGMNAALVDTWNQGQEFRDGVFRMEGADPGRSYRIFFIAPEKRLGTVAELKYDPARKGPLEVRLEPTATIRGKLANADGSVPKAGQAGLKLCFTPEPRKFSDRERYDDDLTDFYSNIVGQRNAFMHDWNTGKQGEFEYQAIIPGAWYELICNDGALSATVSTQILKPGEVLDVGTVTLKERNR